MCNYSTLERKECLVFSLHTNIQSHKSSVVRIGWTLSYLKTILISCITFPQTHGCQLFISSILTPCSLSPFLKKSCITMSTHMLYQYEQTTSKYSRDYLKVFLKHVRDLTVAINNHNCFYLSTRHKWL